MRQSMKQRRSELSSLIIMQKKVGSGRLVQYYGETGGLKRLDSMVNISEPYVIHYPRIVAVAQKDGQRVELIEFFECVGGAMWSKCHYAKSPIVEQVRCVGTTMRYLVKSGSVDLALEGSRFPAGISACSVNEYEIA